MVKDVANACCVADEVSHGGRRGRKARQMIGLVKDVANACCVADEVSHGGRRGREARQMKKMRARQNGISLENATTMISRLTVGFLLITLQIFTSSPHRGRPCHKAILKLEEYSTAKATPNDTNFKRMIDEFNLRIADISSVNFIGLAY
ncbi:hypothetical protein F2Q70_00029313 [Brassica cretica]|uniref:Uncharacterized protein n=1 Tax=Brassica cretica TaxID=69181 RepID=A0A8S9FNE4_BRACR|nr:hypothetical protein F2Q70_00029313 [Brassica cretica]